MLDSFDDFCSSWSGADLGGKMRARVYILPPGLRTRSIFNRVQETFASSSSKNFIFRVQVRVRQK